MIYVVVLLAAVSVALFVAGAAAVFTGREKRVVEQQLASLKPGVGETGRRELEERRRRQERRDRLQGVLEAIGEQMQDDGDGSGSAERKLAQAGIRSQKAVVYYLASRAVLAAGLGAGGLVITGLFGLGMTSVILFAATGALLGWMLPYLYVRYRTRKRKSEIQRALPDALDLMVVCVEAGLGLTQALDRVGKEMDRLSPALSDEFTLVSLEIRAGTPRPEALRNLSRRTGLGDVQSMGMLIQTDRFGTSVARALRTHADALRTKRRQRAEEAAAKTSVKMLFPLVLCVFPAMFVVILGPAVFHLVEVFGG